MPEEVQHGEGEEDAETFAFQAEIAQLLSLIINTYSNKTFLRELISNASHVSPGLARSSGAAPLPLPGGSGGGWYSSKELKVGIVPIPRDCTPTLVDTGIGMTKADLINKLGTIAKSGPHGSPAAVNQLQASPLSLLAHSPETFLPSAGWHRQPRAPKSWAALSVTLINVKCDPIGRGTKVILYLKEDQTEYLEEWHVKEVVKKHSQFTGYPITLCV
ncbi:HS90B protein, partial [Zapornia atra]|nr:HS90B protein [Zapornia atra]